MRIKLPERLIGWLIRRARRTPYFHLEGYMERFWLIPYNRCGIALRVHHILRSDRGRAFHDHPWWYATLILRGGYVEVTPVFDRSGFFVGERREWYGPGSFRIRRARSWHRLEVAPGETTWTLFMTGQKRREWGFLVAPAAKIHWTEYEDAEG